MKFCTNPGRLAVYINNNVNIRVTRILDNEVLCIGFKHEINSDVDLLWACSSARRESHLYNPYIYVNTNMHSLHILILNASFNSL